MANVKQIKLIYDCVCCQSRYKINLDGFERMPLFNAQMSIQAQPASGKIAVIRIGEPTMYLDLSIIHKCSVDLDSVTMGMAHFAGVEYLTEDGSVDAQTN